MPSFAVLDVALAGVGVYLLSRLLSKPSSSNTLPPGPPGKPVIGNLLDMPATEEWLTFSKWGQLYGPVSSITILGQTIVVLNTAKAAENMLDKKSAIYSDRPILQMGGELVGWKNTLALLPYGKRFQSCRRHFHQLIGNNTNMKRFEPMEESATRAFLQRVLATPDELSSHVRWAAASIILRISHGYEVQDTADPLIAVADEALVQFSAATAPGAWLVDVLPVLKLVPDWVPGAGFKLKAKAWANTLLDVVNGPHNFVREQMATGDALPSFTHSLLETKDLSTEDEFDIKWAAASLYTGGADTTVSTIYAFYLAMALNPDVQKRAQEELDSVVGSDRLPSFEDKADLPYTMAVVLEMLRWHVVGPCSIPHRATEDDVHEGFFIPKGTLVFTNLWQMLHDPAVYPDPFVFDPTRFLVTEGKPAQVDPRTICFGFGRRACPGQILAEASVFMSLAMSLAVFDIKKVVGDNPVHEVTSGTISHQKPFKCDIRPRSPKAVSLIHGQD